MNTEPKRISILGSTGSIGTQTLDIIASYPERFRAEVLTAGRNHKLLAEQARRFAPSIVVIADESGAADLQNELFGTGIRVEVGSEAIAEAAGRDEADIVVTAMVGYSGLLPTIRAIEAGKTIALSNKETLVVGGELISRMLDRIPEAKLLPVDSEHSAIFQCLQGESHDTIRRLILTASGGPFRTTPREIFPELTREQTLRHPNWDMGAKVTVDSATMMNKGFEMIEARWLFDIEPSRIDVAVHPQSIVHSMVEFVDGSVKAQLGVPDMHLPIQYALGYPTRLESKRPALTLEQYSSLTFEHPDTTRFPLLRIAYQAAEQGGLAPCVMNAANEVAVARFLAGDIRFVDIPWLVATGLEDIPECGELTLQTLEECHHEATHRAEAIANRIQGHPQDNPFFN
ncbi:MAG: 1-deoxy-D-xylulose-5-phosphate reductoisomerase [Bacteroides sp.]|nr:1-deoxy-D-xylulose-5-phosphate reductoisomerase [Bacteroides sp.]